MLVKLTRQNPMKIYVKIPHLFLVQPVESVSFPYFHQILHLKNDT